MDEFSQYRPDQIGPQPWAIIIVGWSASVIVLVAFFIAISSPG